MTRTRSAMSAAGFGLACAAAAGAQSTSSAPMSAISAFAGVTQNHRRDLTASPLMFEGGGSQLTIGISRSRAIGAFAIDAWVEGGVHRLAPSDGDPKSSERLSEAQLHVAMLRRLDARASGAPGLSVGFALHANSAFTAHGYADPYHPASNFLLGAIALGPAAAWKQRFAGGAVTSTLSVPAIAFVAHSYSTLNKPTAEPALRIVTPRSWRALGGSMVYTPAESRSVGLIYRYRFDVLRFDDVQPVRAVSQSLSVGAIARFGARRR